MNEKVLDLEQVFYFHYLLPRHDWLLLAKTVVVGVRSRGSKSILLLRACTPECYL